jgi:hypothetical protein
MFSVNTPFDRFGLPLVFLVLTQAAWLAMGAWMVVRSIYLLRKPEPLDELPVRGGE